MKRRAPWRFGRTSVDEERLEASGVCWRGRTSSNIGGHGGRKYIALLLYFGVHLLAIEYVAQKSWFAWSSAQNY